MNDLLTGFPFPVIHKKKGWAVLGFSSMWCAAGWEYGDLCTITFRKKKTGKASSPVQSLTAEEKDCICNYDPRFGTSHLSVSLQPWLCFSCDILAVTDLFLMVVTLNRQRQCFYSRHSVKVIPEVCLIESSNLTAGDTTGNTDWTALAADVWTLTIHPAREPSESQPARANAAEFTTDSWMLYQPSLLNQIMRYKCITLSYNICSFYLNWQCMITVMDQLTKSLSNDDATVLQIHCSVQTFRFLFTAGTIPQS